MLGNGGQQLQELVGGLEAINQGSAWWGDQAAGRQFAFRSPTVPLDDGNEVEAPPMQFDFRRDHAALWERI